MRNINNNAPVKCGKKIAITANCKEVWKILTDVNHWADWQTDIVKAEMHGEFKPQSTFIWKSGGAIIRSTLHTVDPTKRVGWTGRTLGIYAVHNWTLTEKDGVTEVNVEESLEGLFAVLLKNAFNKNLEKGMQNWLDLLKQKCEKSSANV
jgi:hypothetical protein